MSDTVRHLPAKDYFALKSATRDLSTRIGGVGKAAEFTRVNHQSMSRYGDAAELSNFAPIDVIADIEAQLGEPVVTRELAALAGFSLVRTQADAAPVSIPHRLVAIITETSELNGSLAEALADGRLDAAERAEILKDCDDAISAIDRLRVALRSGRDG